LDFKHPNEKEESIKLLNAEQILEGTKESQQLEEQD